MAALLVHVYMRPMIKKISGEIEYLLLPHFCQNIYTCFLNKTNFTRVWPHICKIEPLLQNDFLKARKIILITVFAATFIPLNLSYTKKLTENMFQRFKDMSQKYGLL